MCCSFWDNFRRKKIAHATDLKRHRFSPSAGVRLLVLTGIKLTGNRKLDLNKSQRGPYQNMPSCSAASEKSPDVTGFDRCTSPGGSFYVCTDARWPQSLRGVNKYIKFIMPRPGGRCKMYSNYSGTLLLYNVNQEICGFLWENYKDNLTKHGFRR